MYTQAISLALLVISAAAAVSADGAIRLPASRSPRLESRTHSRFTKLSSGVPHRRSGFHSERGNILALSHLSSLAKRQRPANPAPVGPDGTGESAGVGPATTTTSALPVDVTSTSTGEVVPLYDVSYGETYTIDIVIGGTNLTVVADTGSADLWVPSSSCTACREAGMVLTDLTATGTCRADLAYGSGEAVGCSVNTTVTAGNKTVSDFPVVAVTNIDSSFIEEGSDLSGIVGLAPNNASEYANETLPSALYTQGLIDSPTVSFYLARDNASGSEITFGNVTSSQYVNTSTSVSLSQVAPPPDSAALYYVTMDSINVDGQETYGNASVVLDTGTSVILVPDSALEALIPAIYSAYAEYQGSILTTCNATIEPVTITFGGKNWAIDSADLISEAVDEEGTLCLTAIQPSTEDTLWIMGAPVLRNVYSSFNTYTGEVILYSLNTTTLSKT